MVAAWAIGSASTSRDAGIAGEVMRVVVRGPVVVAGRGRQRRDDAGFVAANQLAQIVVQSRGGRNQQRVVIAQTDMQATGWAALCQSVRRG